jgi:hypothetical protein
MVTSEAAKQHVKQGADYRVSFVARSKAHSLKPWRLKHLKTDAWGQPTVDQIAVGARLAQSRSDLIARLMISAGNR